MKYSTEEFVADASVISDEMYPAHGDEAARLGRFHLGIRILLDQYGLDDEEIAEQVLDDNSDQGIDFFETFGGASNVVYVVQVKDHQEFQHAEQLAAIRKMIGEIHFLSSRQRITPEWSDRRKDRFVALRDLRGEEVDVKYVLLLTGNASASDVTSELSEDLSARESVVVIDRRVLSELEDSNRTPANPQVKLRLEDGRHFEVQDRGLIRTLVTLANTHDYVEATQMKGPHIFRLNPRLYLGEKNTNKGMMKTLRDEKERERFHLLNNGITVVCEKYSVNGNEIVVDDFQVVNGCQTTETLWRFYNEDPEGSIDVYVPLRIIETQGSDELAYRISETTNSQSAVLSSDLVANDDCQKRIKFSLESGLPSVFYEARRGEWRKLEKSKVERNKFKIDPKDWDSSGSQGFRKIGLKELAQVLLAVTQSPSNAKEQISGLFGNRSSDSLYNRLFNQSWSDIDQIRLVIETYLYVCAEDNWCPKGRTDEDKKLFGDLARLGRFYVTYLIYRQWRADAGMGYDPDKDEPLLLSTEVSRRILKSLKSEIGTLPSIAVRALASTKKDADVDIRALLRQKKHRETIEKNFDMRLELQDDAQ
jgi:hypothetical protein